MKQKQVDVDKNEISRFAAADNGTLLVHCSFTSVKGLPPDRVVKWEPEPQ